MRDSQYEMRKRKQIRHKKNKKNDHLSLYLTNKEKLINMLVVDNLNVLVVLR
jgi:hypothetical protein